MAKAMIRKSVRFYGFLLRFYPKQYREEFGEEMQYVFSESLKDASAKSGNGGIVRLWIRTLIDTIKSVVAQQLETRRGGGEFMKTKKDMIAQNKVFVWIALITGALLTIPFVLTTLNPNASINGGQGGGWDWESGDFIVMGALLLGTGFAFVHVARLTPRKYRVPIAIAFVLAFLLTWAHLAVGIVDTWPLAGS